MKRCLTRLTFDEPYVAVRPPQNEAKAKLLAQVQSRLSRHGLELVRTVPPPDGREEGKDWPIQAETMIGLRRLDNLQFCVEDVIRHGVRGDLIETGVWRGGATIF